MQTMTSTSTVSRPLHYRQVLTHATHKLRIVVDQRHQAQMTVSGSVRCEEAYGAGVEAEYLMLITEAFVR